MLVSCVFLSAWCYLGCCCYHIKKVHSFSYALRDGRRLHSGKNKY
ncbi:hypothetical protein GLYMA_03G187750v4 [Glycine max]|nr:hypothetical protein GLYMA_03G187750v4 [Glycine max]KAH1070718.1 hypothetical protein GYH30_007668 [Glycine max]